MNHARTDRSTETPMDFEFTSRRINGKPVWVPSEQDTHTPRKRVFTDVSPSTPTFHTPCTPSRPAFGQNTNTPFLFSTPPPQTPHLPAWVPNSNFSPSKAFTQPELHDVDMADSSPAEKSPEKETEGEGERPMAVGALRRVYNKRRARDHSQLGRRRVQVEDAHSSDEESGEEDGYGPVTKKTTNHYTLNMPGPHAPQSDLPFRLLGYVQVGFNASLGAIAIYLAMQFIFTIQRDVEHRVAEYSMDVVQEIAQCALAYKTNLCAQGAVPAMTLQCATWETCMNRDPSKVGRAKVSMEVIGEVIDSFVEPISWKTLTFTIASLTFFTVFINSLLSLFRSRVNPTIPVAHPHIPPYPIPPYPAVHGYLPPMPDWNSKPWKPIEGSEEAAPRRRKLEDGQVAKVK